jgi:Cu(I)/Ag(I) efflux system membrane fusion protein
MSGISDVSFFVHFCTMKKIGIVLLITGWIACTNKGQQADQQKMVGGIQKASTSIGFDSSFGKLATDYFNLKEQFVNEQDSMINFYTRALIKDADSLHFEGLKADSAIIETAKMNTESISAEGEGLLGETTLDNKRKSFYTLSEQMHDLMKLVEYHGQVVYQIHCPMAFKGEGANWLSNTAAIRNPYIPKKMISCGNIIDTINFTK